MNNINWGNHCLALRWNHVYSQQLFSNLTIGYTRFFYNSFSDIYKIEKQSDKTVGTLSNRFTSAIDDIIGKIDFDYYLTNHQIKFGCVFTLHQFSPTMNRVYQNGTPDSNIDTTFGAVKINPIEFISYIEDKFSLTEKLSFNIGFHFCSLTESGRSYYSLQPRIIGNYAITDNLAFKFSYTKMMQPVHLLSNNDAGLPTDLWVPATKEVKPQQSSLFALGITGEVLHDHSFEWSIETFYKTMDNLIEFSDGASFFTGTADWKQKIEKDGKGTVYGIELLLQKKKGNTTGWIAYTLSKNVRQFDRLNFGKPYPYKYDRRHDLSITANHKFNDRTQLSASWIFASGNAITLPSTMYELYVLEWENRNEGNIAYIYDEVHIYGKRNNYRTPIYHRLDISLDLIKKRQRGTRTWTFGLYNAYNRLNSYYLYFNYDKSGKENYIHSPCFR